MPNGGRTGPKKCFRVSPPRPDGELGEEEQGPTKSAIFASGGRRRDRLMNSLTKKRGGAERCFCIVKGGVCSQCPFITTRGNLRSENQRLCLGVKNLGTVPADCRGKKRTKDLAKIKIRRLGVSLSDAGHRVILFFLLFIYIPRRDQYARHLGASFARCQSSSHNFSRTLGKKGGRKIGH